MEIGVPSIELQNLTTGSSLKQLYFSTDILFSTFTLHLHGSIVVTTTLWKIEPYPQIFLIESLVWTENMSDQ